MLIAEYKDREFPHTIKVSGADRDIVKTTTEVSVSILVKTCLSVRKSTVDLYVNLGQRLGRLLMGNPDMSIILDNLYR